MQLPHYMKFLEFFLRLTPAQLIEFHKFSGKKYCYKYIFFCIVRGLFSIYICYISAPVHVTIVADPDLDMALAITFRCYVITRAYNCVLLTRKIMLQQLIKSLMTSYKSTLCNKC